MFIALLLMLFAMVAIVSAVVWGSIYTPLMEMFGGDTDTTDVLNTVKGGYASMDNIFLFLFFMLNLCPIIFAVFVKHHPVFLIINILILVIWLLIAPMFSNMMKTFWDNEQMAQYASGGGGFVTFEAMTRIFQYMPYISVFISIVLMVAMFVKPSSSGSGF